MTTTFIALRRRSRRWVPAAIVAALMAVLGGLLTAGALLRWIEGQWPAFTRPVIDAASATTWDSSVGRTAVIAVGAVGILLLLAAVLPGAPRLSRLRRPADPVAADAELVLTRRGLARMASAAAHRVDGVDRVATSVAGRSVTIRVVTPTRLDVAELRQRVTDTVTARLAEVGLEPAARVRVTVTVKEI